MCVTYQFEKEIFHAYILQLNNLSIFQPPSPMHKIITEKIVEVIHKWIRKIAEPYFTIAF